MAFSFENRDETNITVDGMQMASIHFHSSLFVILVESMLIIVPSQAYNDLYSFNLLTIASYSFDRSCKFDQVTTARVYNWDVHQRRIRQAAAQES